MGNEQNPVTHAFELYARAVADKDVDAFMAIHAPDIQVFDAWGQWEFTGAGQWRELATGWFASLGDESVEVLFTRVHTSIGADVAYGFADVTFTGTSASGHRLRSMTNRISVGMNRSPEGWVIGHQHSSLPINLETGAAMSDPPVH
ncbi:YybH family protein [Paeniglutamicibacter cryotolerans]|uniref:Ketosteroid isomerase-like protein n=1 Tax=Paeniglutamicibacter cryotolerans TaxID=670079 RepID=A0A839QG49_9MICC|nr:nuclear transport factor 2 family protein [Paeniglutamicibacter cryotolerans]MBB2994860.1 ketosteroid isomerase-like protein [Paeniglutamicibacter cryotolerans]